MFRSRGVVRFVAALYLLVSVADARLLAADAAPEKEKNKAASEDLEKQVGDLKSKVDSLEKEYKAAQDDLIKAQAKSAVERAKKVTLARFSLQSDYAEGASDEGVFGDLAPHLLDIVVKLDKAAADERLTGILLEVRGPDLGLGKVDEVRAAIGRLRKAGKKVYADMQFGSTRDYLIASACDEVIVPPSGSIMITGLAAQVTFFKGLLDKLGVKADFIQIGDFKGASEPYTRSEMSPEFRQQFESVIEDYYQQMVETIAADRKLDKAKVIALIDEGMFTAPAALAAGLIDRVCYEDEIEDKLKEKLGADTLTVLKDYGKKKVDYDFSGMVGMMKFMEVLSGADPAAKTSSKGAKIAVIYAVGAIMPGNSGADFLSGQAVGSDTIVKAIRKAEEDATVKGIVLRVDSPGGSALASDLIWREVVKAKKPFIASMGDTAASGGYYISMGADKIYAEPGTLTGSIGVVGGKLALAGLYEKLGVTSDIIRRGRNSSVMSTTDPFTESERDAWKKMMLEVYEQFTTKAAQGRKLPIDKVKELAQGKLYSGRMAKEVGLVDAVGTLQDAIAEVKSLAGLKADEKVEIMVLPKPKSFLEDLLGIQTIGASTQLRNAIPAGLLNGPLVKPLLHSAQSVERLQMLFREPAVTVLPCEVRIH